MMKKTTILIIIIFILINIGCATTSITSLLDPSFEKKKFKRIAVIAAIDNLEYKLKIESAFVEYLTNAKINSIASHKLFFPGRIYSKEEFGKIMFENKTDGCLLIILKDTYEQQVYIPQFSNIFLGYRSASAYSFGGHPVSKPNFIFEVRFYAIPVVSLDKHCWLATAHTTGGAATQLDTLIKSLADSTVEKLIADGLLK